MKTSLLSLLCICYLAGCVSEPKFKELEGVPRLVLAESDGGEVVTLSWKSVAGKKYKLYYLEKGDLNWRPMAGGRSFLGTGETLSLKDRRNPYKSRRRYSIQVEEENK